MNDPINVEIEVSKTDFDKVIGFRRELSKESDRGCSLMAASFLEEELLNLLKKKLIGTTKEKDALFEFNGPLGTFSSKIKLSYSLGLISKSTLKDLDAIRKIRNDFGHNYEPISFTTPSIESRIESLRSSFYEKGEVRTRLLFTNSVMGILADIMSVENTIQAFVEKKDSQLYNKEFQKQQKKIYLDSTKSPNESQ